MDLISISLLSIGAAGIIITIILYLTGDKSKAEEDIISDTGDVTLFNIEVSIFTLMYIFILVILLLIGVISNLSLPLIVGGIPALIPIIVIVLTGYASKRSRVR